MIDRVTEICARYLKNVSKLDLNEFSAKNKVTNIHIIELCCKAAIQ